MCRFDHQFVSPLCAIWVSWANDHQVLGNAEFSMSTRKFRDGRLSSSKLSSQSRCCSNSSSFPLDQRRTCPVRHVILRWDNLQWPSSWSPIAVSHRQIFICRPSRTHCSQNKAQPSIHTNIPKESSLENFWSPIVDNPSPSLSRSCRKTVDCHRPLLSSFAGRASPLLCFYDPILRIFSRSLDLLRRSRSSALPVFALNNNCFPPKVTKSKATLQTTTSLLPKIVQPGLRERERYSIAWERPPTIIFFGQT